LLNISPSISRLQETELVYQDPYELIVAVILSAQCTDKRVNIDHAAFLKSFAVLASWPGLLNGGFRTGQELFLPQQQNQIPGPAGQKSNGGIPRSFCLMMWMNCRSCPGLAGKQLM